VPQLVRGDPERQRLRAPLLDRAMPMGRRRVDDVLARGAASRWGVAGSSRESADECDASTLGMGKEPVLAPRI
jgi:hypothetical protein